MINLAWDSKFLETWTQNILNMKQTY
jgi:hypothetical protein